MSHQDTRIVMASLINYLCNYQGGQDFEAVSLQINQYTDKEIKPKKLRYFLNKEKVIYGWMIKSAMLAAIKYGWIPSSDIEFQSMINTFSEEKNIAIEGLLSAIQSQIVDVDLSYLREILNNYY